MKKIQKKNWGFNYNDLDTSVRPQDDFFRYACGGWIKKNPIPETEPRWGSFMVRRDKNLKNLKTILEDLKKRKNLKSGGIEQKVRDLYLSGMNLKQREKLGVTPIQPWLDRIATLKTKDEALSCIADMHRFGFGPLWRLFVGQDDKDSETYVPFLSQGGLSLPERDYYLKDDPESVRIRKAYLTYRIKLFALAGYSPTEAKVAAQTTFDFEKKLARASMRPHEARNIDHIYHKYPKQWLFKEASGVDWNTYLAQIGITSARTFVVYQPKFVQTAAKLFSQAPLSTLKTYLTAKTLGPAAPFLSKDFVAASFEFNEQTLVGRKKMQPEWKRVLGVINGEIGEALGKLYVQKFFPPEAKREAKKLVNNLFEAYRKRIKNLDWMSEKTKLKALKKLEQMVCKIGYPDTWKTYKGLEIKPDDYLGNILRASEWHHNDMVRRIGKPVDRKEWFMSPQTVNAYYDPNMNQIVFPAGILQAPFFDIHADAALNYGAIGTVIGHEMTHGFDDEGSKFDGLGNYKNWWSKDDRAYFDRRAKLLVSEFNGYKLHGLPINGKLTLGENIADLGGLVLGYDAYLLHLKKNGRMMHDEFTPEQRFFLGFVQFEKGSMTQEFTKLVIRSDPHSPEELRINSPVSNFEPFYEAFNVQKGDKLYKAPTRRVKIW